MSCCSLNTHNFTYFNESKASSFIIPIGNLILKLLTKPAVDIKVQDSFAVRSRGLNETYLHHSDPCRETVFLKNNNDDVAITQLHSL